MVTVEDLAEKWPTKNIPPYGNCIVVPGSEWKKVYDTEFEERGVNCVHTDFGNPNESVVLVRLMGEAAGIRTREEKSGPERKVRHSRLARWTKPEIKKLLKRMGELTGSTKEKSKILAPEFPGRSSDSIRQKYEELSKTPQKSESESEPGEKKGLIGDVLRSVGQAVEGRVAEKEKAVAQDKNGLSKKVIETLDTIVDVIDKFGCQLVMNALEMRELKAKDGFKIPGGLWLAYANALTNDDPKFRRVFREKVEKLLDAST